MAGGWGSAGFTGTVEEAVAVASAAGCCAHAVAENPAHAIVQAKTQEPKRFIPICLNNKN